MQDLNVVTDEHIINHFDSEDRIQSNSYINGAVHNVSFYMPGSPISERPANPSPPSEFSNSSSEDLTNVVDDRMSLPSQAFKTLKRATTDNTYYLSRHGVGKRMVSMPTHKPLPMSAFETPVYAQLSDGTQAEGEHTISFKSELSSPITNQFSETVAGDATRNQFASQPAENQFTQSVTIKRKPVGLVIPNNDPVTQDMTTNSALSSPQFSPGDRTLNYILGGYFTTNIPIEESGSERRSSTDSGTTIADDTLYADTNWHDNMFPVYDDKIAVRDFAYASGQAPRSKVSWENPKLAPDAYETKRPWLEHGSEEEELAEADVGASPVEEELPAKVLTDTEVLNAKSFHLSAPGNDTAKDSDTWSLPSNIYQGDESDIDDDTQAPVRQNAQYPSIPAPPFSSPSGPDSISDSAMYAAKHEGDDVAPQAHRTPSDPASSQSTISKTAEQPERKKPKMLRRMADRITGFLCMHRVDGGRGNFVR